MKDPRVDACRKAGFEIEKDTVWAYGKQFPLTDPLSIHLKVYRTDESVETRYQAMKAAFDLLWPKQILTYNYWMERMFRTHVDPQYEIISLAAGGGVGKAVVNGTPVRTPTGWVPVESLKPNDVLSATDGTVQTVLGVYPQGIRDIYRVHFSDNTFADVDGDHLWTVYEGESPYSITITTTQILNSLPTHFSLPYHSPLYGHHDENLPVHPYTFGVLLGNGAVDKPTLHQYLTASVQQRVDLLRGLLDTAGHVTSSGDAQYTTTDYRLAKHIVDLARGLGFITLLSSNYIVSIFHTPTTSDIPLYPSPDTTLYAQKRITAVTPLPPAHATCIKVSNPNQLFFINDYIVTHNTQTAAYIGSLFWLALPHKRAVIVTSTTLESLKSRIYGYIMRALKESTLNFPYILRSSPPPAIYPPDPDFVHGIFGVAAKLGDEENTIKEIIGRHPKDALLIILDEAPHMPPAIMNSFPNLKKGLADRFQCIAIGNPDSVGDLHGILSTPLNGWDSIDPKKDYSWRTTQPGGICLYFNPYDSPAIHETNSLKKTALSKFLFTEEQLRHAQNTEGVDSESFWRFTMGFWRSRSVDATVMSEVLLSEYNPQSPVEFSPNFALVPFGGLDPSFTSTGDKCILRLGLLGHSTTGNMVLDFRNTSLLFQLTLRSGINKSAETQIAEQVVDILRSYNMPLHHLAIDTTGMGRGLAEVIHMYYGSSAMPPMRIHFLGTERKKPKALLSQFDVRTMSGLEMWETLREFILHKQIYGLDKLAYTQLHTRKIITKSNMRMLEKKSEYKYRMAALKSGLASSPDEADAAGLVVQAAIINYGFHVDQKVPLNATSEQITSDFMQAVRDYQQNVKILTTPVVANDYSGNLTSFISKRGW